MQLAVFSGQFLKNSQHPLAFLAVNRKLSNNMGGLARRWRTIGFLTGRQVNSNARPASQHHTLCFASCPEARVLQPLQETLTAAGVECRVGCGPNPLVRGRPLIIPRIRGKKTQRWPKCPARSSSPRGRKRRGGDEKFPHTPARA